MKIIEKKCPNCGATLNFKPNDLETKCDFCKSEFIIECNQNKNENEIDINKINLTKKIVKTFGIVHIIIAGIIIIIFLTTFFSFLTFEKHINKKQNNIDIKEIQNFSNQKNNKTKIEIKLDDLTEEIKEKLNRATISENEKWNKGINYEIINEPTVIGYYYINDETFNTIKIYTIIEGEYKKNEITKKIYTAYEFTGDNINSLNYSPIITSGTTQLDDYTIIRGYESIEELYDRVIKQNKSKGEILATNKLYID